MLSVLGPSYASGKSLIPMLQLRITQILACDWKSLMDAGLAIMFSNQVMFKTLSGHNLTYTRI